MLARSSQLKKEEKKKTKPKHYITKSNNE